MSTSASELQHVIIVPLTRNQRFTRQPSRIGCSPVLSSLLPQLWQRQTLAAKPLLLLQPADDFMHQESADLLRRFCRAAERVGSPLDELRLSMQGRKLAVIGNQVSNRVASQSILTSLQQDKGFIDRFEWLQFNYLALANSLEWLLFAEEYEDSRERACRRYPHLNQADYGIQAFLQLYGDKAEFLLESPINRFKVAKI